MERGGGEEVKSVGVDEWQIAWRAGVGGILAVGLPGDGTVVVGSHSGVGVFDAVAGDRLLRVRDDGYTWWDEERAAILVQGPDRAIESVPAMGLWGGALPSSTTDGWECLKDTSGALLVRDDERVSVPDDEEFRACGFSLDGSFFVLATSPTLTVLRRRGN